MHLAPLFENRKFTSWTIKRVAEAYCAEWSLLKPTLEHNVLSYTKRVTRISFEGEVSVTVEIVNDKYPEKEFINIAMLLSLSPDPDNLKLHVLNTFYIGLFLDSLVEFKNKKIFTIGKREPWDGSAMQLAAQYFKKIIVVLSNFESAYHLLLDDIYVLEERTLDARSLNTSHHLNQVKAYRLAEIYGHPEKFDEAIKAIKHFASENERAEERLSQLQACNPKTESDWLYTTEILEKLQV